jgi:HEAT repeat protein
LIKYAAPGEQDGNVRASAMEAAAGLRDERAAEVMMEASGDFFIGARARLALKLLGPAAEPAALKQLEGRDLGKRVAACGLLEVIGTKNSLPTLEQVSRDSNEQLARAAGDALRAVKDHGK